jgi:sulfite exporter TauE/SafE
MLMTEPLISMALLTALLGSGHCIGMCGGLVTALALSPHGRQAGLLFQLLYNLGRVATYTLIGFGVGWFGSALTMATAYAGIARGMLLASDLFIIILGLGTVGLWKNYTLWKLEFRGPVQLLSRSVNRLKNIPAACSAIPLGLLMGLLPCGFLYAMVITAAQSASATRGGLIMLAFGIGTVPALVLFGGTAYWLGARARAWMLRGAGLLVVLMGVYNLTHHLQVILAGK